MNTKTIVGALVALVIVGAGAFYGGTKYADSASAHAGAASAEFGNGQFAGARGQGGRMGAGGFTGGEIISKDATSITVKMQNGSTKIVLVGGATQVMKSTTGSIDDLATGTNVSVTGTANSDGSVTAQLVQIRPAGAASAQEQFGH